MKFISLKMVTLSLVMSMSTLMQAKESGSQTGNGGDLYTCRDGAQLSYHILDLAEAEKAGLEMDYPSARGVRASFQAIIKRLATKSPVLANKIALEAEPLLQDFELLKQYGLNDLTELNRQAKTSFFSDQLGEVYDSAHRVSFKNCEAQQLIIRYSPRYEEERKFHIQAEHLLKLNDVNLAALLVHEVLYEMAQSRANVAYSRNRYQGFDTLYLYETHSNSAKVRGFVAYLFSKKFSLPQEQPLTYLERLRSHEIEGIADFYLFGAHIAAGSFYVKEVKNQQVYHGSLASDFVQTLDQVTYTVSAGKGIEFDERGRVLLLQAPKAQGVLEGDIRAWKFSIAKLTRVEWAPEKQTYRFVGMRFTRSFEFHDAHLCFSLTMAELNQLQAGATLESVVNAKEGKNTVYCGGYLENKSAARVEKRWDISGGSADFDKDDNLASVRPDSYLIKDGSWSISTNSFKGSLDSYYLDFYPSGALKAAVLYSGLSLNVEDYKGRNVKLQPTSYYAKFHENENIKNVYAYLPRNGSSLRVATGSRSSKHLSMEELYEFDISMDGKIESVTKKSDFWWIYN